jgi:uncharacterized protein YqeY
MALSQTIDADFKAAMKAKDTLATSCLRLIRAALKNKQKELLRPLEDSEELAVFKTLAKQRRDSIEQFSKAGREDLAGQERKELEIIEHYLPAQLDESGIASILDELFAELQPAGPQDMGQVMKAAMSRFAGQADGKLVSQMVKQRLIGK